jgi:hypothetical protein
MSVAPSERRSGLIPWRRGEPGGARAPCSNSRRVRIAEPGSRHEPPSAVDRAQRAPNTDVGRRGTPPGRLPQPSRGRGECARRSRTFRNHGLSHRVERAPARTGRVELPWSIGSMQALRVERADSRRCLGSVAVSPGQRAAWHPRDAARQGAFDAGETALRCFLATDRACNGARLR